MTDIWDIYYYEPGAGKPIYIAEAASVESVYMAVRVLREEDEIPAGARAFAQKRDSRGVNYPDHIVINPQPS